MKRQLDADKYASAYEYLELFGKEENSFRQEE